MYSPAYIVRKAHRITTPIERNNLERRSEGSSLNLIQFNNGRTPYLAISGVIDAIPAAANTGLPIVHPSDVDCWTPSDSITLRRTRVMTSSIRAAEIRMERSFVVTSLPPSEARSMWMVVPREVEASAAPTMKALRVE